MSDIWYLLETTAPVIKDVVLTGAAIIAAYVGLKGLGAWKSQLVGNTEYELAKQILRSVYEVRDALSSVRNPFMQYSQEPDLPEEKLKELNQQEKQWHAKAQAFQKRWEPVPKAASGLDALLLEAEVVWGSSVKEKVRPLNGLVGELLWAIQDHLEATNPNNAHEKQDPDEVKTRRRIMYARGDEKDEYQQKLTKAIQGIENELKPHIRRYHR